MNGQLVVTCEKESEGEREIETERVRERAAPTQGEAERQPNT